MTNKVTLNRGQVDFLNFYLPEYLFKEGANFYTDKEILNIFEQLINLFLKLGLDCNDEPTKLGLFIEDLTDIFNAVIIEKEIQEQ
ncbi:hypothetical protein IPN35_04020 [Candidatus Peregrinibacteria bacterium]|nr:MAG: hypothetical protein IPN35_04020 [Candidatus Peregrinibacteria bacterium]